MPYLSRPPRTAGQQVWFNDQVFRFPDPELARKAAQRLKDCNHLNSLWELVDLVASLESDHAPDRSGSSLGEG